MQYHTSILSKVAECIAAACARAYLLCTSRRIDVRYRVARAPETFAKIGSLRREVYRTANSAYLLNELDQNGWDPFDQNATSFVAENRSTPNDVFAAVRAVRYPFEVLQFVSEEFLAGSLGNSDHARTVEVSRLVSSRPNKVLTNGLLLFGGIYIALHGVTRYFAYIALPEGVLRLTSGRFAIPNRNPNGYAIISGSITKHAARVGPRLWRSTKSAAPTIVARSTEQRGGFKTRFFSYRPSKGQSFTRGG